MLRSERFGVGLCEVIVFFLLFFQGPIGLRGYPGMMGPKGEAVSAVCLFLSRTAIVVRWLLIKHQSLCSLYQHHSWAAMKPLCVLEANSHKCFKVQVYAPKRANN